MAGVLSVAPSQATLLPADKSDPAISEVATLNPSPPVVSGTLTTLTFTAGLTHIYDRTTVSVNANMVAATQGQTVAEILGQRCRAREPDLPAQAVTADLRSGRLRPGRPIDFAGIRQRSAVAAGGQLPQCHTGTAHRRRPRSAERYGHCAVRRREGRCAAADRQTNVRAQYRVGIGLSGMVQAGTAHAADHPATRPAIHHQSLDPPPAAPTRTARTTRARARLCTTMTLDRVVSLADYQNYALAFAGIAKATATWSWFNQTRGVAVTVAGRRPVIGW